MLKNSKYVVVKAIPTNGGVNEIKVNTEISVTHGCVYMNGGMLPRDYQTDFTRLIEYEEENGFNYLRPDNPRVGDMIIGNK